MISVRDKQKVLSTLNSVLGPSSKGKDDNHKFHCPFCNHRKKKLEIDLTSQDWHCWVCDAKGRKLSSLFSRLKVKNPRTNEVREIYKGETKKSSYNQKEDDIPNLSLPIEFRPLYLPSTSKFDLDYNSAKRYLINRGINHSLIVKYGIGFCSYGDYGGYIIIPSYDFDDRLNYFIARTYIEDNPYKYKNPPVSRDVIVFENQINWTQPITLVEGAFDAISVRRNAIPTLGKVIPDKLMNRIFMSDVKHINMIFDRDAYKKSLEYTNYFTNNGISVNNIIPDSETDAGELGFEKVTHLIKNSKTTNWDDIILSKLNFI